MKTYKKLVLAMIGTLLSLTLLSCGGGGGGNSSATGGGPPGPPPGGGGKTTVITGRVVDGFVAGATVTAYQVNANGTVGAQIGLSVITDQSGNFTLNLGSYSGPVYITSQGGTYIDTATGLTIDLTNSPLILSAFVPFASGNVTVEINPLTTMAADVALTLTSQGTPVATAAAGANSVISNYFGLSNSVLTTALLDLTKANCTSGVSQPSASIDVSAILAGISQLAKTNGVSSPNLVQALIQDVASDGLFDGSASGVAISVPLNSGTGTILLSTIEGPALSGLANAITTFVTSTTNVCGAQVDTSVIAALSNTSNANIFTAPLAPTGVQATTKDGAAVISWDTVTNATSYNLYMATSTGVTASSNQLPGFTSIPNVTSPFAVSTGLTSSTYYFVVTAVSGTSPFTRYESAASAEVSAAVTASLLPAQWAQTVTTGSNQSALTSVATSTDGSVYAAGYITGTGIYSFGTVTATGAYNNGINAVLVKYNGSGQAQWAQSVKAGVDDSYFYSVAAAPDGSAVYAAGYIYGPGTFDFGNSVTVTGTVIGSNPVLVKYNSSGVAQWARTVTAGSGGSDFFSVSAAPDGSIYVAGDIYGTGIYSFGTVSATGTYSNENVVLVKYDSSGNALWAQTVTAGSNGSLFNGVSAAPDGSVYAAGYIIGTGAFTFGSITTAGKFATGVNALLVKYDSTGAALWAQTATAGNNYSNFYGVSAAPDGSVYAAGGIYGTGLFAFGTVTAAGTYSNENIALVKYDSTGNAQWVQTVTAGSNGSLFYSVSAGADGSVCAAGYITGTDTYKFGGNTAAIGTYNNENTVLVQYNSSGVVQWAPTMITGNGDSVFSGVSVASGGFVYAAGGIYGSGGYNLGNGVVTPGSYGYTNILLVQYKYNGFGSITVSW